ncbi:hypothetical protein HAX54_019742, partial [Datura stramonium]|nr:hypothetical protein [Datura stramonium]
MSGAPRQRCPDLEKFDEHFGEIEGATCQALSRAEIVGNLTKYAVRYMGGVPG